jgi:hypothetical protein
VGGQLRRVGVVEVVEEDARRTRLGRAREDRDADQARERQEQASGFDGDDSTLAAPNGLPSVR